jgi:hypothetical protein
MQKTVKQLNDLYPRSCIREVLDRILDKGNGSYVPMFTVMGDPLAMTYEDRTAIQYALRGLSSHAQFPETLKQSSYALYALGYESPTDFPASWGTHFLSIDRVRRARVHTGVSSTPTAIADLSADRLKHIASTIVDLEVLPWQLPAEPELTALNDLLGTPDLQEWAYVIPKLTGQRFYVSAASQAIRILGNLQSHQRRNLRHIVIQEDRKCVALPQCHIHGLLPYLEESKGLHIERKVDLWNTVYAKII